MHTRQGPEFDTRNPDEIKKKQDKPGASVVHNLLALLFCSRYGLRESEILELVAPPGMRQLPQAVWARLTRSLCQYIQLSVTRDVSTLRFFHQQIKAAVERRYLTYAADKTRVYRRLAEFFQQKADPRGDLTWSGTDERAFADLVHYKMRALDLRDLKNTLGSLRFLQARARFGTSSMENLLHDYSEAQATVRHMK